MLVKEGTTVSAASLNNLLDIPSRPVALLRAHDVISRWTIATFVSVREKLDIDGFIKFSKLLPLSGMLFASVGPIFVK